MQGWMDGCLVPEMLLLILFPQIQVHHITQHPSPLVSHQQYVFSSRPPVTS